MAKICLIDDQPEILLTLEEMLHPLGHDVVIFNSATEAVEIIPIMLPDLIITDILMPQMDGFELTKAMRSDARTEQIPILFLSAVTHEAEIARAFECGGNDYIGKPLRKVEVVARIKTHLALKQRFDTLNHLLERSFHDIFTPLGVIRNSSELLQMKMEENRYLSRIRIATQLLEGIYSDMYFMIRHKANRTLHIESLDLAQAIAERIEYFTPIAQSKRITLQPRIQTQETIVAMDHDGLVRMLDNTLGNAIKHGKSDSTVRIEIDRDDRLVLRVINEGPKIRETAAIFRQNYRENELQPGLGLGLGIVQMVCAEHSISIRVESDDVQTMFAFTFPEPV